MVGAKSISGPAVKKTKAKLCHRVLLLSLFICAAQNRVCALSASFMTKSRSVGCRIPTASSVIVIGFHRTGPPLTKLCLLATKEKMKDETDEKDNTGAPLLYDPISKIAVARADDSYIAETHASEDMILCRNNDVTELDFCGEYECDGDEDERNNEKVKTSVGPELMGSASKVRFVSGRTRTGKPGNFLSGLKSTGSTIHKRNITGVPRKDKDLGKLHGGLCNERNVEDSGRSLTAAIRSTVEGLIQKQIEIRSKSCHDDTLFTMESFHDVKPKKLLTKSDFTKTQHFRKSTDLVSDISAPPSITSIPDFISNQISVRMALPCDDIAIANLRLSVFSDFSEDLRNQFCQRSCEVLSKRRKHGAICLVARRCAPSNTPNIEWIVGGVECSTHEFKNTELGKQRPEGTIMYVTEVAVSPNSRRSGVGTMLLKATDQLARFKKVETVYLHVDVENTAAFELYKKAGYDILDSTNYIYSEFTTALNLQDGATKGRKHYLLHKTMTECQTWLPSSYNRSTLGFEIPR